MRKQLFFASLLCTVFLGDYGLFARQSNLVDQKINIIIMAIDSADILKNSIHFHVAELKKSNISTNNKLALEREYEELRTQINAVYWKMSKDVTLVEANALVYERYKPELNPLVKKAYNYMDKVNSTLKRNPVGVGTLDSGDWIGIVLELGRKIKGHLFYNKLKLKSWKDIK